MQSANNANDWQATAAYLYTLRLSTAQLAWEYLRRNPTYREDWRASGARVSRAAGHLWGLDRPGGS